MIITHHLLYCDGDDCTSDADCQAENPDHLVGETPTLVRKIAAGRSGFVRRRHPRTGVMSDFCSYCAMQMRES